MPMSRWGYGYGFEDSVLVYFGLVILLLHAAISIPYVVWILSRGAYKSVGWTTLGELISLAMDSGSKDERDGFGGTEWKKTRWTERIGIRQVEPVSEETTSSSKVKEKPKDVFVMRRFHPKDVTNKDLESN